MSEMWINMGPQHPMTHGLWNLRVKVDGELVVDVKPEIGYLHRALEKISESRTFTQTINLVDRACYAASFSWETVYVTAVENLMDVEVPLRAQYIRVISLELQRIASHLVWVAAFAADLGLLTVFLYTMRDRDLVQDLLQLYTGGRLTYEYNRIGGVRNDVPDNFKDRVEKVVDYLNKKIDEYEDMMDKSDVFLLRTENLGILKREDVFDYGFTGPMERGSGIKKDTRKDRPYLSYGDFDFDIPVSSDCDTYGRYRVRMEEMRQSINIIKQALARLPAGEVMAKKVPKYAPEGSAVSVIEDPRGEALCYVVSDGTDRPYRMKLRSPGFIHIASCPVLLRGYRVADVPSIMGGIDICIGETDR